MKLDDHAGLGDLDSAPRGPRDEGDLRAQLGGTAAQGDERDPQGTQPPQVAVGRQAGIEDQVPGPVPVGARPEVNKAEDLVRLVAFAEIRIDVAERVAVGVLGQEGEYAL